MDVAAKDEGMIVLRTVTFLAYSSLTFEKTWHRHLQLRATEYSRFQVA